ncbi:unnamed protein product [Spirodela intermedia]|uniref:Uncharacterized protein n=1 Tax=Spirodela intermedia TaxID=51605 RepID=A0A7I8IJ06_SPIIN|nr:unnamed protein product [Spirodela intermedia]CAA6657717.1 unnamed protein product [Spirodela intermedia]
MAEQTRRSLLFSTCSLLMAALFAYSASVQLDDPDWYLWLPLYAVASAVNLLQIGTTVKSVQSVARLTLLIGGALFLKVARVVREKLGSALVTVSMLLHLEPLPPISEEKPTARRCVDYGMASAVAVSLGLCIRFFMVDKRDMRK